VLFVRLVVAIREEQDQRSDRKHGNCYQSAHAERPPFLVDRGHHLLGSVSILLGNAQPLAKSAQSKVMRKMEPCRDTHPRRIGVKFPRMHR